MSKLNGKIVEVEITRDGQKMNRIGRLTTAGSRTNYGSKHPKNFITTLQASLICAGPATILSDEEVARCQPFDVAAYNRD